MAQGGMGALQVEGRKIIVAKGVKIDWYHTRDVKIIPLKKHTSDSKKVRMVYSFFSCYFTHIFGFATWYFLIIFHETYTLHTTPIV